MTSTLEQRTILFTGGGTAGHVTPNLALMERLRGEGWKICYVGSVNGMERALIEEKTDVPYYGINAGKLRRYLDVKNLTDPFRVLQGVSQARRLLRELRPDVVFSKGGYVSVPVVVAAHGQCPVITHESDYTPGLANRINARFADAVCVTFEDTLQNVGSKGIHTGTPIRPSLFRGKAARGLAFTGLDGSRPILLVMGGSLGAQAVNDAVQASLPRLLQAFDVVHLCGAGKLTPRKLPGYVQYEYLNEELPDVLAASSLVLSRAGANAVFELLSLCKPSLLIPLPRAASRGDQLLNAGYFSRKGYAMVLEQESMTAESLFDALNDLYDRRLSYISAMSAAEKADGTDEVLEVIREWAEKGIHHAR